MREAAMVLKATSMARSLFRISDFQQQCGFPFCDPLPILWVNLDRVGSSWVEMGGRGEAAAELPKSPELPKLIIEKLRQNLTTDQHR
jgi:hypothetical protein